MELIIYITVDGDIFAKNITVHYNSVVINSG